MASGVALVGISLAGKGFIKVYRLVKTGTAFAGTQTSLGKVYHGGFERQMTRREAGLILNIR